MTLTRAFRQVHDNLSSFGVRVTAAKIARRLANRLSRRHAGRGLPRSLHVETAMCCNLSCEYCVLRKAWHGDRLMPLERFKALEPWLRGLDTLCLSGLAEPLMNPQLGECIAFARAVSPRVVVSIMTNATLLDQHWCETLVASGLDTLGFSIDSADHDANASIRHGSERSTVLDNVRRLVAVRAQTRSRTPDIFAITVLQRKNYRDLPGVVDAVAEAGVRRLEVNTMEPFDEALLDDALLEERLIPDDLADTLQRTRETARRAGVHLRLAAFAPSRPSCFRAETPMILANGDVVPCAALAYERDCFYAVNESGQVERVRRHCGSRLFGNVFERSFAGIWGSEEYRVFREAVGRGQFPPECRECLIKHDIVCVTGDGDPGRAIRGIRRAATSVRPGSCPAPRSCAESSAPPRGTSPG